MKNSLLFSFLIIQVLGFCQGIKLDTTYERQFSKSERIIYNIKKYQPYVIRHDSTIFTEQTSTIIDTIKKDTTFYKTIAYIKKPDKMECLQITPEYSRIIKNHNDDISYVKLKPANLKNPYEGTMFLKLYKYKGEYLISPEVWSVIWFKDNYLFQACTQCDGQCLSLQKCHWLDSLTIEFKGYSMNSEDEKDFRIIRLKLIDSKRKIYRTEICYFLKDKPAIEYYTPLSQLCNFRHFHNRSYNIKTNVDDMPMMYNIGFDKEK